MTALELARLQFGIVTVFHFIFVPLSIGLAFFVAMLQTAHYRTGKAVYVRMTRFWGKLMLISFAVGVVTGIVQEFQFGMNWSEYSRYVGDVFGAPLAMEGARRVLPGVDVHRAVDLRPGPPAAAGPPGHDLARRHRHRAVRLLHPRRQLVDAAPGRLRDRRVRARRDDQHLGGPHQLDRRSTPSATRSSARSRPPAW